MIRHLLILVLAIVLGSGCSDPADEKPPVEEDPPEAEFVSLTITPAGESLPFGTVPSFSVVLKNLGDEPVRIRPYLMLEITRDDGESFGYGTDVDRAIGAEPIASGEERSFVFPPWDLDRENERYRRRPRALLPAEYRASAAMWVLVDDEPQSAKSPAVSFDVVDDGTGDAKIIEAVQTGRGVEGALELVIERKPDGGIGLSFRNRGEKTLYLGPWFTWNWVGHDGRPRRQGSGPRSGAYVEIEPGDSRALAGISFGKSREPGTYRLWAEYTNRRGRRLAKSNELRIRVE